MKEKGITLKDLNELAKESGLSEDTELFVFGQTRLRAVTEVYTETPSQDALYTDIYLRAEEEPDLTNIRTSSEIAEMMSYCVTCNFCKIKEKCDEICKHKTESICVKMWKKWLKGELN